MIRNLTGSKRKFEAGEDSAEPVVVRRKPNTEIPVAVAATPVFPVSDPTTAVPPRRRRRYGGKTPSLMNTGSHPWGLPNVIMSLEEKEEDEVLFKKPMDAQERADDERELNRAAQKSLKKSGPSLL